MRSATEGLEKLSKVFPNRRVALLHGRMKSDEKESVMRAFSLGTIDVLVSTTVIEVGVDVAFSLGTIDVLVSTTVIEVGVDVANATVMLIEHAERFGLAQLHQLRGRVGRGRHRSICILKTPNRMNDIARQRIQAMLSTTDGFRLAEIDLRLRGPGEVAGTRQSGIPEFRVANLMEDGVVLALAQREARALVERDGEYGKVIDALSAHLRGGGPAGLATVG